MSAPIFPKWLDVSPKEQLAPSAGVPKKSFGQNFLTAPHHLDVIARLVMELTRDPAKTVLEYGPGLGALTAYLLYRGATVHAVERDRDLVPLLATRFAEPIAEGRLTVHEDNALTYSTDVVRAGGAIAGNLPYHHAGDLLIRALESWPGIGGAVFLVQKEVADRAAAVPSTKAYGALTVLVQSRFEVRTAHIVPAGAFWPVPDVDGGVLTLRARAEAQGGPHQFETLRTLVKTSFAMRRKTLRNNLRATPDLLEALRAVGATDTARAEELAPEIYGKAAAILDGVTRA